MDTRGLKSMLREAAALGEGPERERAFAELTDLLMVFVRARMGGKLRARRESVDVCQSVAKSFVEDLGRGRLAFENDAALGAYLRQAVASKLAELAREDNAVKRGGGAATVPIGPTGSSAIAHDPADPTTASLIVGTQELVDRAIESLSGEDREIVMLRRRGMEWDQISAATGIAAAALRKRWSRLQQRIMETGDGGEAGPA